MPLGAFRINSIGKLLSTGGFVEARASAAQRFVDLVGTSISSTGGRFSGHAFKQGEGSDYIQVNPVDTTWGLTTGKPWTVEFWFKTSTTSLNLSSNIGLAGLDFGSGAGIALRYVKFDSNKIRAYISGSTVDIPLSTNWRHFAFSYSGSGNVRFYINGTLQFQNSFSYTPSNDKRWYYGSTNDDSGQPTWQWDELRISNISRYDSNFTAPTTPFENDGNTLGLFHFDGNYNDDNNL